MALPKRSDRVGNFFVGSIYFVYHVQIEQEENETLSDIKPTATVTLDSQIP